MNWLDIVIIVMILISGFSGLRNGLIKTVFSLAGLVIGVILAGRYYSALAGNLAFISDERIASVLAFIIIFLVVMIIASLLGMIFTKIVSAVLLGWLNHLSGAVLGIALGAISIAALLAIWVQFIGPSGPVSDSMLASILIERLPLVTALLPQEFSSLPQIFQ